MRLFRDRMHAGTLLGQRLARRFPAGERADALVLALPRGGVPVGHAVAEQLGVALDVCVVRKLGLPGNEEYAIGAIACGQRILHADVVAALGLSEVAVAGIERREREELVRREMLYREGRAAPQLAGRTVILVDDGVATGATMEAAAGAIRKAAPRHLMIAIPVAPADTAAMLEARVDEMICLAKPEPFYAVGQWYEEFGQTSDREVIALLAAARQWAVRELRNASPE